MVKEKDELMGQQLILDNTNQQIEFQMDQTEYEKNKDEKRVEIETEPAQCKERSADRFMEHECRLREEDKAQQRELFKLLLVVMATRFQASLTPSAPAPALLPVSPPCCCVPQTLQSLDSSGVGWIIS